VAVGVRGVRGVFICPALAERRVPPDFRQKRASLAADFALCIVHCRRASHVTTDRALKITPLPWDATLDTRPLAQIYDNTVATYKFYWFVSILDILVRERRRHMSFWEVIAGMVAEAWYPVHYFRLSFGKSDSLYEQIIALQRELLIPIDAAKSDVKAAITANLDAPRIKSLLRKFTLNVPYRFLSPWIAYTTDADVVRRSRTFDGGCLYAITGDAIDINPAWEGYLNDNYTILRDYSFWNLTVFLQKRNPNVPDVPSKLVKPIQRDSLTAQRRFWDAYIDINGPMQCIYTGAPLVKNGYDLDHFVPWSFVSHNLLWNLIPANSNINSSKSNNLPVLDRYLRPFARLHREALATLYHRRPNDRILEDYLIVHDSLPELVGLAEDDFYGVFQKTFSPIVQIAENMGFTYWRPGTEYHFYEPDEAQTPLSY
jgi:hypothetical protein